MTSARRDMREISANAHHRDRHHLDANDRFELTRCIRMNFREIWKLDRGHANNGQLVCT